jgi:hypothetical protein
MKLVRLTPSEWSQLEQIPVGGIFLHINLQHSGIPRDKIGSTYQAIQITKHGRETNSDSKVPELDFQKVISLQLTNIFPNIAIQKFIAPNNHPLILANNTGVLESLEDRYKSVRDLNNDQIISMECFVREFKIL